MKRKAKLDLSPESKSLQRAIARHLKRGLPLAGLLAAALFCGCDEQSGALSGAVAPVPSVKGGNANPPGNRPNERPDTPFVGILLPPEKADPPDNRGNENKRPVADGSMPKKKADK